MANQHVDASIDGSGYRQGHICVFAKPPRPGMVKTRLAAAVGKLGASQLANAFLRDTWDGVSALPWARSILATTEDPLKRIDLFSEMEIWLQGDGDLGQRIERVLQRALRFGPFAMAIGADTPGLPRRLFEQARTALDKADAVLGPCDDGGFYLVGLTGCPRGLFRDLPWSADDTFARTHARLCERGLSVEVIETWFDVDQLEDLHRLRRLIDHGDIIAPATTRVVSRIAASSGGRPR